MQSFPRCKSTIHPIKRHTRRLKAAGSPRSAPVAAGKLLPAGKDDCGGALQASPGELDAPSPEAAALAAAGCEAPKPTPPPNPVPNPPLAANPKPGALDGTPRPPLLCGRLNRLPEPPWAMAGPLGVADGGPPAARVAEDWGPGRPGKIPPPMDWAGPLGAPWPKLKVAGAGALAG